MKKVIYSIIIILCLASITRSVQEISAILQKKSIITQAEQKQTALSQRNTSLKQQIVRTQGPDYIQEEARNKLFLSLPNETRVLVPSQTNQTSEVSTQTILPNWQQWLKSFHLCCGATIESRL